MLNVQFNAIRIHKLRTYTILGNIMDFMNPLSIIVITIYVIRTVNTQKPAKNCVIHEVI